MWFSLPLGFSMDRMTVSLVGILRIDDLSSFWSYVWKHFKLYILLIPGAEPVKTMVQALLEMG
jgi:hypothetical protein